MSNIQRMIGILGFVVVLSTGIENASGQCPTPPSGFDCKCNGDDAKWVCAKWAAPGAPTEGADFVVDYTCTDCSDAPRVEFIAADDGWELYSEVISSGAAADLGDILLASDVSPNNGNFTVSIYKSGGYGAANVSSIVLDSSDVNWSGHSTLTGAGSGTVIAGNVTGDIEVIERGGNGGAAEGTTYIFGDVQGAITIPHVTGTVFITGSVSQDIAICDITDGVFTILGSISGNLTVSDKISAGNLKVEDNVAAGKTVHIAEMTGNSDLTFSTGSGNSFDGDLYLGNGVADAAMLVLIGHLGGEVDLNGYDVVGHLRVSVGTTSARIIDGGDVSGMVTLSYYYPKEFEGIATFNSVPTGGLIETLQEGSLSGTLNVTNNVAGTIHITGSFNSGGAINVGGSVSGDIELYETAGAITITNDLFGDIEIEDNFTGSVTVGGALANGFVGGGRILVAGDCSGDIKVGKQTGSLTLIHIAGGLSGGLTSGGTIEINTSQGEFNAEGDIVIGSAVCPQSPPSIMFDGCIRIHEDRVNADYGDLDGSITVCGCHSTSDNLNICIDGLDNGNVIISQNDCTNQVGWSCGTCP